MIKIPEQQGGDLVQLIASARQRATGDHVKVGNQIFEGGVVDVVGNVVTYLAEHEHDLLDRQRKRPLFDYEKTALEEVKNALDHGRAGVGDYCLVEAGRAIGSYETAVQSNIQNIIEAATPIYHYGERLLVYGQKIDPTNPNISRVQEKIATLNKAK